MVPLTLSVHSCHCHIMAQQTVKVSTVLTYESWGSSWLPVLRTSLLFCSWRSPRVLQYDHWLLLWSPCPRRHIIIMLNTHVQHVFQGSSVSTQTMCVYGNISSHHSLTITDFTWCPASSKNFAAVSPAMPPPMIATWRGVLAAGRPLSTMSRSSL